MATPAQPPQKPSTPQTKECCHNAALMHDQFVHVHIADLLQRNWINLQQLHLLSASTAALQTQVA